MSTVLIVDRDPEFRVAVKKILGVEFEFVGQASSSTVAEQLWGALKPQLVVVDSVMPGILEVVGRQRCPATRVLVLTDRCDEEELVSSIAAGVDGFTLKNATTEELLLAAESVVKGLGYIYPEIFHRFVSQGVGSRVNGVGRKGALTTREREILKLLVEGNTVKQIACDLNLSYKTIDAHKFNLMRKLDIHNKAQLVQYAVRKRIITIPVDSGDTAA